MNECLVDVTIPCRAFLKRMATFFHHLRIENQKKGVIDSRFVALILLNCFFPR